MEIDRLKRAEAGLRETDRQKDAFLAVLGHELRNPLSAIRNSIHIIKGNENNRARIKQGREILERHVDRLVRIVDDMLDMARIT